MPRPASLRALPAVPKALGKVRTINAHPPHEAAGILLADLEFLDDVEIPLRGDPLEIIK